MFSKESIKQFLKPDWRKVLITIFPIGFISFALFVFLLDIIFTKETDIIGIILNSKAGFLILSLSHLLFSYIVSCFIIKKLKPTRKIFLSFLFLFIITPVIYALSSYCILVPGETCNIQRISILGIELSDSIIWLISIILSYLLSCLLIFAWDKIKSTRLKK